MSRKKVELDPQKTACMGDGKCWTGAYGRIGRTANVTCIYDCPKLGYSYCPACKELGGLGFLLKHRKCFACFMTDKTKELTVGDELKKDIEKTVNVAKQTMDHLF